MHSASLQRVTSGSVGRAWRNFMKGGFPEVAASEGGATIPSNKGKSESVRRRLTPRRLPSRRLGMRSPASERHHLVVDVMADIGAAEIGDAGAPAPILHDL